ncbi:MAG: transaldolase [Bdellovibrionales bacterium]|nr:transaldolase [Bdellovibrionales bacterium]
MKLENIKTRIFADGASISDILDLNKLPHISGFTTNPTLMKKAGVEDYTAFAKEVLSHIKDKPVSFEVFADDFDEMYSQAMLINGWAENVYVKIPVMNTKKQHSYQLIQRLSNEGVKLNVTAVFTLEQVQQIKEALMNSKGAVVSIFAGRIADTGVDPMPIMIQAKKMLKDNPNVELLWASPRELLNIIQANEVGCDIITATPDVLKKLSSLEKDLEQFSHETVEMFYNDACSAGFSL